MVNTNTASPVRIRLVHAALAALWAIARSAETEPHAAGALLSARAAVRRGDYDAARVALGTVAVTSTSERVATVAGYTYATIEAPTDGEAFVAARGATDAAAVLA